MGIVHSWTGGANRWALILTLTRGLLRKRFRLTPGDVLLGYGQGLAADEASQFTLGDCIRRSMQQEDSSPLAAIRRELASSQLTQERGAVMLMRQ